MPDASTLPKPEKRRAFRPGDVLKKYVEQRGMCAKCGCDLVRSGYERDHIQRHDALGKTSFDNLQLLCPPCHADKTRDDNREAKKGARIRGERGQRARREKRGGSSIKAPPVSALSKTARGYVKRKISSRGFK